MISKATDGFACYRCFRVRPRSKFTKSKSTRHYARDVDRHIRHCIDCGIADGKYRSGTIFSVVPKYHSRGRRMEDHMMICPACHSPGRMSRFTSCLTCCAQMDELDWDPDELELVRQGFRWVPCGMCCVSQLVMNPDLCESCVGATRKLRKDAKDEEVRQRFAVKIERKGPGRRRDLAEDEEVGLADALWLQ